MVKVALTALLALLVSQVSSNPLLQDGDIAMKASAGDWDGVHQLIQKYIKSGLQTPQPQLTPSSGSYGSLQTNGPSLGTSENNTPQGRYYSQAEYSYQRANNDNGVVTEDKGGLGMINDNGRISYYKPDPDSYAQLTQLPNFGAAPYGQRR